MRFELTTHRVLVRDPLWTGTSAGLTVEIYETFETFKVKPPRRVENARVGAPCHTRAK